MKKKSKFLKIVRGILIGLLLIVLVVNVNVIIQAKSNPNLIPSIFGYKPFIVLSGSMETEIYVGDLVIVKTVDTNTLQVNDIIAFRDDQNLVTTHRIINVVNTEKGIGYETKGDNNNTTDKEIVYPDKVEGKYSLRIPKVGNFILFIQEPLGFTIMMLSIFIICLFTYLISNKKIDNKMNDEELKEFEEFKKAKAKAQEEQDAQH